MLLSSIICDTIYDWSLQFVIYKAILLLILFEMSGIYLKKYIINKSANEFMINLVFISI